MPAAVLVGKTLLLLARNNSEWTAANHGRYQIASAIKAGHYQVEKAILGMFLECLNGDIVYHQTELLPVTEDDRMKMARRAIKQALGRKKRTP